MFFACASQMPDTMKNIVCILNTCWCVFGLSVFFNSAKVCKEYPGVFREHKPWVSKKNTHVCSENTSHWWVRSNLCSFLLTFHIHLQLSTKILPSSLLLLLLLLLKPTAHTQVWVWKLHSQPHKHLRHGKLKKSQHRELQPTVACTKLFATELFATELFATELFDTELFDTELFATELFDTELFATELQRSVSNSIGKVISAFEPGPAGNILEIGTLYTFILQTPMGKLRPLNCETWIERSN